MPPQRLAVQRAMTKEVPVMAQHLAVKQAAGRLGVSRCGDSYWLKAATRDHRNGNLMRDRCVECAHVNGQAQAAVLTCRGACDSRTAPGSDSLAQVQSAGVVHLLDEPR